MLDPSTQYLVPSTNPFVAEARRILERLARSHPHEDVRRAAIEALEALSEMKGERALTVILDVAREHPDRQVRRRAIELLGESDDPRARALLERILTRP